MARDIVLIGLGREAGAACAYFAIAEPEARIWANDDNPEKALAFASAHGGTALDAAGVIDKTAPDALFLRAPGAPPYHAILSALTAAQRPLTTYLGYWLSRHRGSVLATITGSKGKSTTTSLCGLILQHAGVDVRVGGNIGVVPEAPPGSEKWVFETSSYQLHDIPAAAPVHAMTTLFPEHLDWHGGFDNYLAAKLRPFAIDPLCVGVIPHALRDRVAHLPNKFLSADTVAHLKGDALSVTREGDSVRAALSPAGAARLGDNPLLAHNLVVATAVALTASGQAPEVIARAASAALDAWTGLPSRQALLGEFGGRLWVDDALATIPQATLAALQQWPSRPVRLIMGGRDRAQDFTTLFEYVNARANVSVHAYGDSAKRVVAGVSRAQLCATLDEALNAAFFASARGDVILLSPAGATQEPGASYQDRARRFAEFANSKEAHDG